VKATAADARPRDQAPPVVTDPEPPPTETSPPSGGCSYSTGARPGSATLLLVLVLLRLRWRRQDPVPSPRVRAWGGLGRGRRSFEIVVVEDLEKRAAPP
jgi:hypothetical protein